MQKQHDKREIQPTDDATERGSGNTPALEVERLSKTFETAEDEIVAVDDISFSVESGSVVGLLGPNGAGKTTTIKCILGTMLPDAGDVRVNGINVAKRPKEAYRHIDAMLEGARNDYWRLTVKENLRYFATVSGVDPDSVADRHERLLKQLEMDEKADEPVRDLSRGMKQKVSLASVLASDADVVFLDEPTLGLDVESSTTLRKELGRIVDERELTVVLSSHDMDVIEDICDRVIIVSDGRVIADDAVETLLRSFDTYGYRIASHDIEPHVISIIEGQFDDVETEQYNGRTVLEVATDSTGFYELTDLLSSHDVTLDSVDTVEPDLEEAFLQMTRGNQQ
ncbi:ABC transporter ATP-binding protein [Halorussus salinus]|uniref:ABC transporter ATP-binding protein n=1 Tax=Halorussus salinus TaxID=1364935 RepID=UPI0010928C4D|nr:ABC transporter ATP-binding protein [Halorussus salinus]